MEIRRLSFRLLGVLAVLLGAMSARAQNSAPANPNASPSAKAILAYIQSLSGRSDHRMLSGQWAGYGPSARLDNLSKIFQQTGQWPAYLGVSYTDYTNNGVSPQIPNQLATAYWNAGGLVEVDCHFATSPNGGSLSDPTVNLIDCITPGTAANAAWVRTLDTVAAGLQQLQQAGVVVMWRPLHDMNVGYFWWSGKPAGDFRQFWQYLFNYFTVTKGLNNLLWVYGPDAGGATTDYYPGDRYVDLTGFSAYGDVVDAAHFGGYPELVGLGKPFGFAEFGPFGTSNPPGTYDYAQFINGAESNFPNAVFFMSWDGNWSPANNANAAGLYHDPRVITRSVLATDLFSNSSRLTNLSVLGTAGTNAGALVLGFAVAGSGSEPILARAVGPTLASFGVPGGAAAPQLQLFAGSTLTATNAGWGGSSSLSATFSAVGAFALPADSKDSAIATSVGSGNYSLNISANPAGLALGELYETAATSAKLVNLSTLAFTGTGANVLTVGFTISGSAPRRVVIRGIGPSLAQFGVAGALADPQLQLFSGSTVMAANDDWKGDADLATAFDQVGAFSLNAGSKDAALETTLGPGSYSVQVSGTGGTTGMALAEVYELP
jgi:mannan endo-1,4-beta-mannosidase